MPTSAPTDTFLDGWPGQSSAAIIRPDGTVAPIGDTARPYALASVTKLLTSLAVLVAHEEGTLDLDEPVTDDGATTADFLAHSSGMAFDTSKSLAAPRTRRIYSNMAYDHVANAVAERAGMTFDRYLSEAVSEPLGCKSISLNGSAGAGASGSVDDLVAIIDAWRRPLLVSDHTLKRATTPHLEDLSGVLPGFGTQRPNPWGLGPEIRGAKDPHWTSPHNSTTTYGHFGQSGTMLWVDPVANVAVVSLCTEPFGPWAANAWPTFGTQALEWATS